MNDCDGCNSVQVIKDAHKVLESDYGIPFSDSLWIFGQRTGLLSLLSFERTNDGYCVAKRPEYMDLVGFVKSGKIDTLHTWGDFPYGGFERKLVEQAMPHLKGLNLVAWTDHGGFSDLQNLLPLGRGDVPGKYYHLDYCHELGIRYYSRSIDTTVFRSASRLFTKCGYGFYFKRFRGPPKWHVNSICLTDLPQQIKMAEKNSLWHRCSADIIILTHLYAHPNPMMPEGWESLAPETYSSHLPDEVDSCLRKLANKVDSGTLEILRFKDLVDTT